jgi:hypothetical protein
MSLPSHTPELHQDTPTPGKRKPRCARALFGRPSRSEMEAFFATHGIEQVSKMAYVSQALITSIVTWLRNLLCTQSLLD